MNIVYNNTVPTVAPDTFLTFPGSGELLPGPATLVWIVYADLDIDQSFAVRVYEKSQLFASPYVIERETVPGDETGSSHTGFQSTPLPLPADTWGTMFGVTIVGGTTSHPLYVAAIGL